MTEETFFRVTNKMIYKELQRIKELVIETNGKVKLNRWVATTALTLTVGVIIALIRGGV